MILTRTKLAAACLLGAAAVGLMASAPHPDQELRVCADPFDLPFSNEQEQGFENKIAHVVAQDLNARVVNYWWPSRRGVLRNSILGGFCDVMIQAPVGLDPVATTKPYYRSTYYFVFRADRGLRLRSLDDTILKHVKIGVNIIGYDYTNTPPAHALGSRGIIGLVGFGNFLNPDPKADHPEDIIRAVAKDSIDVAIVWGPLAGQPAGFGFDLSGVEVVPRLLLPLPWRGRHAPSDRHRPRSALGLEQGRNGVSPRLVRIHGAERPSRQGNAGVEGAARHRGGEAAVPVREGAERRLVEARSAAPRVGSEEEPVTRAVRGPALACLVAGSGVALQAQQPLTRAAVLAALDAATPQAPADFTGKDLSGLDLSGIDFKRANLSRCRLVKTSLAKAQLFAVTLSDAIATEADFSGAQLDASVMYRADMRHAILRDASLFAVIAYDADFSDADLTRARIISPMSRARFARATLSHANLGADPGNQSMGVMRTDASGVDFTGSDLSGANLRKVLLVRADLTGADLTDADLTGADLLGAILRNIRGRDSIRGLDPAIHAEQAIFND